MPSTLLRFLQYTLIGAICLTPFVGSATRAPYEATFTLTAYYSPEPGQIAYARGGYIAEKILNGEGTHGASGKPVFSGMIAAPSTYDFGTVVDLEGLGIFEISDRGGAIVSAGQRALAKHDRIDIWMGYGEEALARALEFGVQHVNATVYPNGTTQPAVAFDAKKLPAPMRRLAAYESEHLLDMRAEFGDIGLTVKYVQEYLKELNYFNDTPTGYYGPITKQALQLFINDMNLDESSDFISGPTIAYLLAAISTEKTPVLDGHIYSDSTNKERISTAQRALRGLGYYQGKNHGIYDQNFANAVMELQKDNLLIADSTSVGAGNIGPKTLKALTEANYRLRLANTAKSYKDMQRINETIKNSDTYVGQFLEMGWQGKEVERLQRMLQKLGYFTEDINGVFGPATKASVIAFQINEGIMNSANDLYAGEVGPQTLKALRTKERLAALQAVRSFGWSVL